MALDRTRDPDFAARIFGGRPEHTLALLRAAWPAAVGPDIARRTEVVALDRGVLRIKVPDAGWQRSLLRMRGGHPGAPAQRGGRRRAAGPGLRLRARGPRPASPLPAARPRRLPPAPRAVTEAAAAIPDPEIRARFVAAAARYLARFGADQKGGRAPGSGSTAG